MREEIGRYLSMSRVIKLALSFSLPFLEPSAMAGPEDDSPEQPPTADARAMIFLVEYAVALPLTLFLFFLYQILITHKVNASTNMNELLQQSGFVFAGVFLTLAVCHFADIYRHPPYEK